MSYFGSLRLVDPAAVNLAFSGVAPVAVAVLGMFGLTSGGSDGMRRLETLLHWALFATVVLLAVIVSTGQSGFPRLDPAIGLAGVTLAAFAGVAISITATVSSVRTPLTLRRRPAPCAMRRVRRAGLDRTRRKWP
jgi:hypothetical protein